MTQRRDTGHVCSGEGTHQEVVMKETLGRVCTPKAGAESFSALDESTYKQTLQTDAASSGESGCGRGLSVSTTRDFISYYQERNKPRIFPLQHKQFSFGGVVQSEIYMKAHNPAEEEEIHTFKIE